MNFFYSIILGILQGLTEFWPISSSGHLIIAHDILKFDFIDNLSFDVALHLGTLFALIIFFAKDIYKYIIAFFQSLCKWNFKNDFNQRMSWFILIGSIPAFVFGYLLENWAETIFRNLLLVSILLIFVGIIFIIFEKIFKKFKSLAELNWKTVIIIGLAQVLALVPGVSRSGITILAGLSQNLKRESAARFSFLLSIPVVFGAGVKRIFDLLQTSLTIDQLFVLIFGFLSAGLAGLLAIKFLLKYLENHSLNIFAYWRFLVGVLVILYLVIR